MSDADLSLMAHLMRRAGFGATRDELEAYAARGYEAVVDDLLHPERFPDVDQDVLDRYYPSPKGGIATEHWVFRMVNSQGPLKEKMALFLHQVFATGSDKVGHPRSSKRQIEMFRRVGLSDLRAILTELSKDVAMIMWLDNNENIRQNPNENYGRELLELFSMGVGNYTEEDVKAATHAFTGWSFTTPFLDLKREGFPARFVFREEAHDGDVKTFLGETGRFNGEDVIDIIVKQPATARFISRRLYDFFVADEPPVAAWNEVPPQDPAAIDTLVKVFFDSGAEMREILRVLFNSDFFKESRFKRVKSPVELVTGIIKLVGTYRFPDRGFGELGASGAMGQQLLQPPTVEGWHTGREWIDGGTLNTRVNFAVEQVGDATKPGVRGLIDRLAERSPMSPEQFVDTCLDLVGPITIGDDSRSGLLGYARLGGDLKLGTDTQRESGKDRVTRMLQLIVSTREFQFN